SSPNDATEASADVSRGGIEPAIQAIPRARAGAHGERDARITMHPSFRAPDAGVARNLRSARLVLCLVVLAVPLASGASAPAGTSTRSATPGTNGHLLVASGHRHEMGLFAMQPRSGDRRLLEYGGDQGAAYSPDGTKIAFMNNYDGDYEICVMNADGTGSKQLTKNSATDTYPSWS